MNALILDGTTEVSPFSERSLEALQEILDKNSISFEVITLREKTISHCRGCFKCWIKTPGICTIDDDARDITRKMIQSDLVVFFTPIHFGGYSRFLKAQLDRSICLVLPMFGKFNGEIHHKKRYETYPSILGIGLLTEENSESADLFREHVYRNSLNLHSPQVTTIILHPDLEYARITSTASDALLDMEVLA
ncbi:MAG: flavodoxin family protein [Candidatus Thorarchaeota archaeon]